MNRPSDNLDMCRSCVRASWILRRIGFRDDIVWGVIPGRDGTTLVHGTHSNSPQVVTKSLEKKGYLVPLPTHGPVPQGLDDMVEVDKAYLAPLCVTYRSELAWVTAGRPTRVMVYMAHPVAPNKLATFKQNISNANLWLKWLRSLSASQCSELTGVAYAQKPIIHAPWLGGIIPDEEFVGGREAAMAEGRDTVSIYDEVWYTGGRVSDGMSYEGQHSIVSRDLTYLGKLPPVKWVGLGKLTTSDISKKLNGRNKKA